MSQIRFLGAMSWCLLMVMLYTTILVTIASGSSKYPSSVFVGDTYTYFVGMTMAVVCILGHFSPHIRFNAAQASGAPIVFMNIQTESLLTKISGDITVSSQINVGSLPNIGNTSVYGFEGYHGINIDVVKAVQLRFFPLAKEIPVEIRIKNTDTKLGFAISRTEEVSINSIS